jgi:hypothetical protein
MSDIEKVASKKGGKKKWIVIICVIIVLLSAIIGNSDSGKSSGSSAGYNSDIASESIANNADDSVSEQADFILDESTLNVENIGELDTSNLQLKYGDLISVINGSSNDKKVVVIKAKITDSWNNELTIEQNYFSVCDLIKNRGFSVCDEIQYWAVADMSNGNESKVISFTIGSDLIQQIAAGNIIENQLGNYVDDLWIHPSLHS